MTSIEEQTSASPVQFKNARGQMLSGSLSGPVGEVAVVCCHGMLSNQHGEKHVALANALAARGLACLRFDFAGLGDSEGSLFDLSYSNEMQDLWAAIDYIAELGVKRVAIFGSSMGGGVAYLNAARDHRIVGVATMAAVGHPEEIEDRFPRDTHLWRKRGYVEFEQGRIATAFLDDAMQHNVISAVGIVTCPILVIHGEKDEVVPVYEAHDIASAARRASLDIVEDADHRFSDPKARAKALESIADFLAKVLEKPAST